MPEATFQSQLLSKNQPNASSTPNSKKQQSIWTREHHENQTVQDLYETYWASLKGKTKSEATWCPQVRQETPSRNSSSPEAARKRGSWRERNTSDRLLLFRSNVLRRSGCQEELTAYEIHAAIGPLKCCKVFNIFGSVRVPSRLKSSSSHHWAQLSPRRWIRNWGVKFRTSCFGSFVRIYPRTKRCLHLRSRLFDIAFFLRRYAWFLKIYSTRESVFHFNRLYR